MDFNAVVAVGGIEDCSYCNQIIDLFSCSHWRICFSVIGQSCGKFWKTCGSPLSYRILQIFCWNSVNSSIAFAIKQRVDDVENIETPKVVSIVALGWIGQNDVSCRRASVLGAADQKELILFSSWWLFSATCLEIRTEKLPGGSKRFRAAPQLRGGFSWHVRRCHCHHSIFRFPVNFFAQFRVLFADDWKKAVIRLGFHFKSAICKTQKTPLLKDFESIDFEQEDAGILNNRKSKLTYYNYSSQHNILRILPRECSPKGAGRKKEVHISKGLLSSSSYRIQSVRFLPLWLLQDDKCSPPNIQLN